MRITLILMGMRKASKYYLSKGQEIWTGILCSRHGNKEVVKENQY